jgi:hypothetical protein
MEYQATNPIDCSCQLQSSEAGEITNIPGVENIEAASIDIANHTLNDLSQRKVTVHISLRVIHRVANGPGLSSFHDLLDVGEVNLDLAENQVACALSGDPEMAVFIPWVKRLTVR